MNSSRGGAFRQGSVPENYERRLAPVVFEPWAKVLLGKVDVKPGDRVLDVASGTGVVARLAAELAGPEGRVVASDLSEAMLDYARSLAPRSIEVVEAPATDLRAAGEEFDVVLCQQGLPFFTDRAGAAAEMRRVLRPGGAAGMSVWAAGHRVEPFDDYIEAFAAVGAEPPFPNALDTASYTMAQDELASVLLGAGFAEVDISKVELDLSWPDAGAAAGGILGTPFGPIVATMADEQRRALDAELARRFPGPGEVVRRGVAHVVRAAA